MSFHDDSHILSQLGILASRNESPREISYSSSKVRTFSGKYRFVDVNINESAVVKSESDEEETVFDRNSLLSPPKDVEVYRKGPETYTCMYIILLLTYFGVGIWCPLSRLVIPSSKNVLFRSLVEDNTGLLVGSIAGKLFCRRISITLLLFLCTVVVSVSSWIIYDFPEVNGARVIDFLLDFASGSILYGGLASWFIFWRGCNRKLLFFYVLLAIGSSFVLFLHHPVFNEVVPHKREAVLSNAYGGSIVVPGSVNDSMAIKLRKPQLVQGIQRMDSKSEQNQQMRKVVTFNYTQASNDNSLEIKKIFPTILPTIVYQSWSGGNYSSATEHVVTTKTASATTNLTLEQSSPSPPNDALSPMNFLAKEKRLDGLVKNVFTTATVAIYVMAFVCCCIPFTIKTDKKFSKLFDPTVTGLTRSCRLRLAIVQAIASLLESLLELAAAVFSSQKNTYNMSVLLHVVVAISRSFAIVSGQFAYSIFGCCLALICFSLGSVLLIIPFGEPFVSFVLMSLGIGVFGLMVFLHVETCVHPRCSTQLDYYIFPSLIGRIFSAVFCSLLQPQTSSEIIGATLVWSALLIISFVLLVKSLRKAARLREIMEYSTSPFSTASGEYVSLMEEHVGIGLSEEEMRDDIAS